MEKIPTIRYVREGYGLNECGIVCLTYPREKKNSVTAAKMADSSDDHVMSVGLPNMYTQIKIVNRQTGLFSCLNNRSINQIEKLILRSYD